MLSKRLQLVQDRPELPVQGRSPWPMGSANLGLEIAIVDAGDHLCHRGSNFVGWRSSPEAVVGLAAGDRRAEFREYFPAEGVEVGPDRQCAGGYVVRLLDDAEKPKGVIDATLVAWPVKQHLTVWENQKLLAK